MNDGSSKVHEPRAFFGRKRGDRLSPRKAALFETLLPKVALDLCVRAPQNLTSLFSAPVRDVRLEIGFGGAEHLLAQARMHPDIGFIASDGFLNAAGKALAGIEDLKLANIRAASRRRRASARLAAAGRIVAHRSAVSRPVAETPALEAPLRAGR